MIKTTAELLKIYGSHYQIARLVENGEWKKVGHGLYADGEEELSELEILCARYPHAVMTMESAFAFYHLSDYVPNRYTFVTPLNAHRMQNNKVLQSFMTNDMIGIGVIEVKTNNGIIRLYDKERMLIELFRLKAKFPPDYHREVVNAYRELVKEEAIDFRKIQSYCKRFKKGNILKARIEEVIL
ncbi:MAG: hypothetical protein J6038_03145 [Bacilli bacterium]|nr:hypothetical protein [Bacilli bacterium]